VAAVQAARAERDEFKRDFKAKHLGLKATSEKKAPNAFEKESEDARRHLHQHEPSAEAAGDIGAAHGKSRAHIIRRYRLSGNPAVLKVIAEFVTWRRYEPIQTATLTDCDQGHPT
jgi:hypothetical protein